MSIADRITSMTQHTKEAYNKIESLGADLTGVNKNLDNIADVLDDVYASYPKVTGSGTELSLSNCKKAGMEIDYKATDTTQNTTTGKNLFGLTNGTYTNNGITAVVNNGEITLNGTDSSAATNFLYIDLKADIGWVQNTTYTISANNPESIGDNGSNYCALRINGGGQYDTRLGTINATYTATISRNDMLPNRICIRTNAGITYTNFKLKPQLEQSQTATSYEPYTGAIPSPNPSYPQDVQVVKGNNTIKATGKNLLNYNIRYAKGTSITISGVTVTYNIDGSITLNGEMTENNLELTGGYDRLHINVDNTKTYYSLVKVVSGSFTKSGTVNTVLAYDCIYYTGTTPNTYYRNYSLSTTTVSTQLDVTGTAFLTRYRIWQDSSSGHTTFNNFRVQFAIYEADNTTEWEPYQAPGSYPVNLRGKNLFDKNTIVAGDITTQTPNIRLSSRQNLWLEPGTYTFSTNIISPYRYVIQIQNAGLPPLSNYPNYILDSGWKTSSTLTYTFTIATAGWFTLLLSKENNAELTVSDAKAFNYQLELSSTATTYQPYWSYELCKLDTYQDKIRKSTGKNLFNKSDSTHTLNAYIDANGVVTSETNNRIRFIPCKANTTYTVSKMSSQRFRIATYNAIPQIGSTTNNFVTDYTATSLTITSRSNDTYLAVWYYNGGLDTLTEQQVLNSIQIEENTTATEYEPYGKVWYKKAYIGKVVLNGSETEWTYYSSTSKPVFYLRTDLNNINYKIESGLICFSNYYQGKGEVSSFDDVYNLGNNSIAFRTAYTRLTIRDDRFDNATDFTTWLSTHNTSVYYVLANPTYTIITEQALIDQLEAIKYSMEGTTIITQTNEDKPFELDVEALTNISKLTVLSQAEYNALTPDSNTIYIVRG